MGQKHYPTSTRSRPDGAAARSRLKAVSAKLRSQVEGNVAKDRIIEELSVYQEEIRQQNKQLVETQQWLEESRDRYADLYDFAPFAYVTLDGNGVIEELNLTGTILLGLERERAVGMPLLVFVAEADRPAFLRHMSRCRRELFRVTTEVMLKPRSGPALPVQLSSRVGPSVTIGRTSFRTAVTDLTELRQSAAELNEYRQRLRSLTSELSLAEARERQRIATALHDNLAQLLALAKIKLGTLAKMAGPREGVMEVKELVGQALEQARSLTLELSPPVLQSLGLEAAIEWLAQQNQRHGPRIEVVAEPRPLRMAEDVKILLFQATRELLTNVIKHAEATHVMVAVRTAGDSIEIAVEDNGVGFNGSGQDPLWLKSDGFGLFSIRTRLDYLGGAMEIDSRPGGGTRVRLRAPLATASDVTPGRRSVAKRIDDAAHKPARSPVSDPSAEAGRSKPAVPPSRQNAARGADLPIPARRSSGMLEPMDRSPESSTASQATAGADRADLNGKRRDSSRAGGAAVRAAAATARTNARGDPIHAAHHQNSARR